MLGVGFGTARSKDLFSTWICNTGVLGLGVFIWYLISLDVLSSAEPTFLVFLKNNTPGEERQEAENQSGKESIKSCGSDGKNRK